MVIHRYKSDYATVDELMNLGGATVRLFDAHPSVRDEEQFVTFSCGNTLLAVEIAWAWTKHMESKHRKLNRKKAR